MTHSVLRYAFMASAFAGSMLVSPPESKAIFHWCRGCGTPAAAYAPAPVYMAPAPAPVIAQYNPCNTCAPATVNYVPQTAYRPVVVNVPVTTYQPVAACGPCGNQVTAMRPVTTVVQQTQYVPYTTYRPVYSAAYAATIVPQVVQYAPVNTVQYAPATVVQYAPAPSPAVPYCAPTAPATVIAPAPALQTAPAPSLPPAGSTPNYDPSNPPTAPSDIHMKPTPEDPALPYKAAPAATIAPPRASTDIDARTAARPATPAYRPYAPPAQVRPVSATDGWRQSAR